jgi:hypothetical protein
MRKEGGNLGFIVRVEKCILTPEMQAVCPFET